MIKYFDECKRIDENNDTILKEIENCEFSTLNEHEIVNLANSLFKLFKENFENNNYAAMEKISNYCKDIINNCIDRNIYTETYCAETIIDIVCFVFEQMYMYEDKVSVLKTIIESENITKELRIRALEGILAPEPEIQNAIADEKGKFSALLKQLTN